MNPTRSTPLAEDMEIARLSPALTRVTDQAGAAIARQFNGPLTALRLYMCEIKQHARLLAQGAEERVYLQQVVEHAFQQTERICALMKEIQTLTRDLPSLSATRLDGRRERATPRAGFARGTLYYHQTPARRL